MEREQLEDEMIQWGIKLATALGWELGPEGVSLDDMLEEVRRLRRERE